jgi:hypothetical protein
LGHQVKSTGIAPEFERLLHTSLRKNEKAWDEGSGRGLDAKYVLFISLNFSQANYSS